MKSAAKVKPYRPPDAAEIEAMLDHMAGLMTRNPRVQHLGLPIWRALERELKKAKEAEAILAAVHARVTRSMGRTEARSS